MKLTLHRALKISRPGIWIWIAGAYLVGIGSLDGLTLLHAIEFFLYLFPINFFLYGINDIYDYPSDKLNPQKEGLRGAIVKPREAAVVRTLAYLCAGGVLAVSFFSLNIEHIALTALLLFLMFAYSHPRFRLKEIPFIDSLVSAAGYLLPILISFSLHTSVTNISPVWYMLLLPKMAMHALTTLKDETYDKRAGVLTTAVFLGRTKTLILSFFYLVIPVIFFLNNLFIVVILSTLAFGTFILAIIRERHDDTYLNMLIGAIISSHFMMLLYFILKAQLY